MAIKIAFAIQKGGVAKTTSSVVVAEILAASDYEVLLVDLDSQGNATQMVSKQSIYDYEGDTIYEAMVENDPASHIHKAKDNLYFMAAEDQMALFSRYIYTSEIKHPARVLQRTLSQVEDEFDFIILDCPPNMSDIVTNAIIYADYVVIPIDAGAFGLDALERFTRFVKSAKTEGHTHAEILGILFTLRDTRSRHEKGIVKNIKASYGDKVFKSEIRKRAKLKEAALDGVLLETKADAKVYGDYLNFMEEVMERV